MSGHVTDEGGTSASNPVDTYRYPRHVLFYSIYLYSVHLLSSLSLAGFLYLVLIQRDKWPVLSGVDGEIKTNLRSRFNIDTRYITTEPDVKLNELI